MEDEFDLMASNKKVEPITFGSCISISLENQNKCFLSMENFISTKLNIKRFDSASLSSNFNFSIFRILPFSNFANFKNQDELHDLLQNFTEKATMLSEKELKERKDTIRDLKTNLDSEIHSNMLIYNKLKGTPVLFGSSVFQLVHVATMKYLSLNDTDKDNLSFELIDFPNSKSFFKFLPCLKLQKQRNNFVYDKDLVVISSTRMIMNRNPCLFTNYSDQPTEQTDLTEVKQAGKVSANIEETKNWKLHLYQHETDEDPEKNSIRVGDAIWLNLSETNHILTTSLQTDPFEQQHMFEGGGPSHSHRASRPGLSIADDSHFDSPGRELLDESGVLLSARNEEEVEGKINPFFESEILSRLVLEFKESEAQKSTNSSTGGMSAGGLWMFESPQVFEGGPLEWERPYRLKHVNTERYLRVHRVSAKQFYVELSSVVDDNLLFNLVPIKNLLRKEEEKKNVAKDSYFRLQHMNTKRWISFRDDSVIGAHDKEVRRKEGQSFKIPTLSAQPRELDTFKMVKADYQELWEISFLLSAIPTFVDLIDYMKPLENRTLTPAELHVMRNFDEIADKAIDCIDSLEAFCNNKLPASLAMNQEFLHISPIRQKILKEQYILGLLCWLLSRGFPTNEELAKIDWQLIEQSLKKNQNVEDISPTLKQIPIGQNTRAKKQDMQKATYIRKKYSLCLRIYELIKLMCTQNSSNQDYTFKFLSFYVNHLGHGSFVSELLCEIIRNNEKIIYGLHQIPIAGKMLTSSVTGDLNQQGVKAITPEGRTFFKQVVNKFREFERFEKREFMELLKIGCLYQEQAIYINQDKVFRLIFEDASFRDNYLINLVLQDDELMISLKDGLFPFGSFFSRENLERYKTEIEFLKDQLDLYAILCMNRNYNCAGAFRKIFQVDVLITYITNEEIPDDIKASLVKLIATIHIDKEPRTVQEKPNLVRVLEIDLDEIQRKIRGKQLFNLASLSTSNKLNKKDSVKADKKKIYIELNTRSPVIEKDKSPLMNEIEMSRGEEELADEQLEKLKRFILRYLKDKSLLCTAKITNGSIYTRLTSEVVKITGQMLKFGMFNTKVIKQSMKTQFLAGSTHGLVRTISGDFDGKTKFKRESEFERLICYLTPLLEFDEEYFKAMNQLGVKRKQAQKDQEDNNVLSAMLQGATGLGKSIFAFKQIFALGGEDLDKRAKKANIDDNEAEIIRDQIFKKPQSLKKVLNKFSNKTFTIKEEDVQGNYEVDIKIGICEVFDYIFNMREDFVIDNLVNFFKGPFLEKAYEDTSKELDKMDILGSLKTLLPDSSLQVGSYYDEEASKFKNYTKYEELRSFDAVLERPFIESLLMGFFFTNSAPLQNALVKLLERCCSEKANLKDSIEKLELLVSEEDQSLHAKLKKKLIALKNLTSNAQIWLQIIERSLYQPNYFDVMEACFKKVQQIQAIFKSDNPLEEETLMIRQRIFRYLGGHKTIFEVLQKGFLVFESYLEVFRQADTSELTLKYRIDVADKIVLLFRLLHSLLSRFCYKNPRYQYLLYQSFNRLMLVNKLNLGQIELMVEIFRGNYDLARSISEAKLKTFCDLIVQHGQKEIFLQVFDILLSHPEQDIQVVQKKVLLVILNDDYSDQINPFSENKKKFKVYRNTFQPDKDPFFYTSKLLEIIAKCLKGKVNVTLVSKVFKFIQIKDLIELLHHATEKEQELLSHDMNAEAANYLKYIEAAKTAAAEILLVFFAKFSQSFDYLSECTKTLFSYFDLETRRITQGNLSQTYLIYVLDNLTELVTTCAGNYLKDSGVANINFEFGHESHQVEAASKRCALRLAKRVLGDLEEYVTKIEVKESQVRSLALLANILKLPMPTILREYLDNIERERSIADEDYTTESFAKKSSRAQKQTDSFKARNQRYQSGASSNFYDQERASSSIAARERSIAKKLTISDILQTQNNPAGQVSILWKTFKEKILNSDYLKKAIKQDVNVLSNSIMNFWATFVEAEDKEIRDFFITTEDLLVKFFEYLEYWIQKKAKKESVIFLIKALGRIIKNVSDNEEEMIERQEMFDRLNATKIMLVLIWEEKQDDTQYIYSIFSFMIHLLSGGNTTVQKTIYDFFNSHSSSEKFFRKMNDLILREITQIDFSSKYSVSKEISQLGMKLLRLLQLFCEGHNLDLQNYLRQQVNSKNNYDLVTLTTKLLSSYRVNSKNFESVMQCFDTLTELVQGPCQANQVTIVNSKFLEFAVSLLNEEEKAIDYFHTGGGPDFFTTKSGRTSRLSKMSKQYQSLSRGSFTAPGKGSFTAQGSHMGSDSIHRSSSLIINRKRRMKLNIDQLAKVKYKCLITLVSLLECSNSGSNISSRIIRAIPVSVLTNNLVQVYRQYKRIYKKGECPESAFNHHKEDYKPEKPEHAGFIIENGFNIYILINLFVDNRAQDSLEDEELNELLDNSKQDKLLGAFNQGFIGELTKFWRSLFSNFVGLMDMVKKNVIDKAIKSGMVNEEEAKLLEKELEKKQFISEAMSFFGSNMAHIEIVRNNKLQKIYFPVLPFCKFLSEDSKEEFQEDVNRASTKTKLLDLMERSDYLIRNMKHEEKMDQFLNHYKIFGLITNHFKLWEYSSTILGIILNVFIIASYSTRFGDGLDQPHLFFNANSPVGMNAIYTLGVLNLVFSSLVVAHFFLKRAPILIEDIWTGYFDQPFHLIKTPLVFIYKVIISFIRGLKDFDILYNCLEIMFAILGLVVHPFFFFFMLMDIARIGLLRNVFKAVWEPKVSIILTILVFVLAQFYFTLIGYTFFSDHYDFGKTCESLFECFLTTFDYTFKETGAVGAYLKDPDTNHYEVNPETGEEELVEEPGIINWGRFFFDNTFKIITVLIIVNMIAGIIIDKFGALKDELQEKEEDMTRHCFVCGIDREKLDKSSDTKQGYESHIKRDHYMWNYVFYKAYLQFKESTEHDGNESYIAEKISKFDISWFPINRALSIKDEENETNEKIEKVSKITRYVADIRTKLKGNITRMNRLAETFENH